MVPVRRMDLGGRFPVDRPILAGSGASFAYDGRASTWWSTTTTIGVGHDVNGSIASEAVVMGRALPKEMISRRSRSLGEVTHVVMWGRNPATGCIPGPG